MVMALSFPDARQLSDEVLAALRLRALRGCELGFCEAEVAELLGVARETVSRWYAAYRHGGLDALPQERSGRPVGSGRLLSELQEAQIRYRLDESDPDAWGIPAPTRTRRAVQELIALTCGIRLPARTVGAALAR